MGVYLIFVHPFASKYIQIRVYTFVLWKKCSVDNAGNNSVLKSQKKIRDAFQCFIEY